MELMKCFKCAIKNSHDIQADDNIVVCTQCGILVHSSKMDILLDLCESCLRPLTDYVIDNGEEADETKINKFGSEGVQDADKYDIDNSSVTSDEVVEIVKVYEFSKTDTIVSIQCNRVVIDHILFLDPINKTTLRYYTSSYWALDLLYYYDQFSALYNPGSNGYAMYIG
jgi:hypothetical protein